MLGVNRSMLSHVHPEIRRLLMPIIFLRRRWRELLDRRSRRMVDRLAMLIVEDPVLEVAAFRGQFALSARSALFRQLAMYGEYEPELTKLSLHNLDPERDVIDVGANIGFHSVLYAKSLTRGKLLAIEPMPNALRRLRRNIALNNVEHKVTVFEGVVSSEPGMVEMKTISGQEEFSSMGVMDHPSIAGARYTVESVQATTIDDLVDGLCFTPGFIKIDVEGSEHLVLEGARRTLQIHRPVVVSELSDYLLRRNGSSAREVVRTIQGLGYKVLDPFSPNRQPGYREFGDIVCLPL